MEIVALVESEEHVCTRYRLSAYKGHFAKSGYSLKYLPWPKSFVGLLSLAAKLQNKTVIIQRKLPPSWLTWLIKRSCKHLIFDFDDAIFLRDSYSKKRMDDPSKLARFVALSKAADAMVAGNQFLANVTAEHTNTSKICVIPTVIDTSKYHPKTSPPLNDSLEMVWIGSKSTLQSLEIIRPILEQLGRTFPNLSLKVICDSFPSFENLKVTPVHWQESIEVAEISNSDLGICFMPDDRWSRGKCGLKLLQYMAAGLPVIANPVGVHNEIIRHGHNGFLANTYEDWSNAIAHIYQNKEKQNLMGRRGREIVDSLYSVNANAENWISLLNNLGQQKLQAG
ncbi:MAG: glycosyltransferase [Planctomycetes bacterium]|nr:glycosyltransferase [Planctomycetota bacterium]NBY03797.1 glycosyltransferase [Planctomycetota bacterium]